MKTVLITLLIAATLSITASARIPLLRVDMVLLEHSAAGDKTLMAPLVITTSGKQATIKAGKFEYNITPILYDDGTVEVSAILTKRAGKNTLQVVDQRIKAKLGHATEVRVDNLIFQTTTSLLK